ncbi:putative nucleic acid-binding protein [Methylopila capsulata]|uniref:Ribonuclease VapC n=1 Tax=Methylopila capsulata TaxID=61654 RepID=A0A9W6IRZ6_9HYPH|nr:type II toxin-antitoxin system VapC family toxin [Methylopila capsulata]MBM7850150.1 putative nucleic acid-binding protein [Methylopila capsulata]GLK55442.1 hypothetical protein GCM10008170_14610 [Methylopila capsulata]
MSLVVDASVVVKWYVDEVRSAEARRLLAGDDLLAAPAHVEAEVGQVLRRRVQSREISIAQALAAVELLQDTLVLIPISGLMPAAIEMACGACVSVYDSLYVAAALAWGAPLATDDGKLIASIERSPFAGRVAFHPLNAFG